ncbi:hypothetical protein JXA88_18600 [Candidatus Fermentibacteria bacterium]|nr:hypothetical protein [Candidatus Fermentibacteria bacterium]
MYRWVLPWCVPAIVLAGLFCGTPACAPREATEGSPADMTPLFGSSFRAVWVQDIGDGSDFEVQGDRLRLMGYDSSDPRGEVVILPEIANYARPLITRQGDRIVFSSRKTAKAYIVNWDGSNLREITDGLGVAVWIDPLSAEEWLFVARPGANTDSTGWPMGSIWRYPIDRPAAGELVWDRTDIDIDNFQVSADGTRACGLFPWPSGGMAELPNGAWRKYDEGCWTSLAPDNSYRSWVFDGNHRDLSVFDDEGTNKRILHLGTLPGMNNCEVRHPRWSNHPRYMTMTGPYCADDGTGRAVSGHGVEVFVGRFAEDFASIDELVRLTRNARADFFPDVWIAASHQDMPDTGSIPPRKAMPEPADVSRSGTFPSPEGVAFVWENRSAPNIVTANGVFVRTCRVIPRGQAWYGRFFDMVLRGGAFEAEDVDQSMLDQWKISNALSIEAVLTPAKRSQSPASIIAYGPPAGSPQFMLSQCGDSLVVAIQTSGSGSPSTAVLCRLNETLPNHLLVSYQQGRLACYRDGRLETTVSRIQGGFDSWTVQHLTFGNALDGLAPWAGSLEGITLWSRFIDEEEAAHRAQTRLSTVRGRPEADSWRVDATLVEVTPIPDPRTVAPYHRALVVNAYDVSYNPPEGSPRILVAHWGILDRAVLAGVPAEIGSTYGLVLQRFEDHPQLESERLLMENSDLTLPLFYDIGLLLARP